MISYKNIIPALIGLIALTSCAQPPAGSIQAITEPIAFPGAEGFGKFTTGGRGGKVYIVTNLNDKGPGSFREAAEAKENRIIVFAVAGTIHLTSQLNIRGNATIAGQSAPGDGICIADNPVSLSGDNIILRYVRFRMGDRYQNTGMVHGAGSDDALSVSKRKHIIIDHCTMSWSTDEAFSVYGGDSTTLQWNIISEPLNYSYHFETGDKDFEHHGYGGIWGGAHLSAHHNLFAHCVSRNPRFNGTRLGADIEFVDFRNNVIYNWGSNNVYGGESGNYNIVNNYFKPGPGTAKAVRSRIVNPGKTDILPYGKFYVNGNYVEDAPDVSSNNDLGIQLPKTAGIEKAGLKLSTAIPSVEINSQSAESAFVDVLKYAGASFKRDTLDQRIINDVKTGNGKFIDVQGGYPHGTVYEISKSAWPVLIAGTPLLDSDKDGMPDEWEIKNKLNPTDSADNNQFTLSKTYTNIEVYLNSIIK